MAAFSSLSHRTAWFPRDELAGPTTLHGACEEHIAALGEHVRQTTLCKLGDDVQTSPNAEAPLETSEHTRITAVTFGLMMRGMEALELSAHFRREPDHSATPVIVWTVKESTLQDRSRLQHHVRCVFAKGDGPPIEWAGELEASVRGQLEPLKEVNL